MSDDIWRKIPANAVDPWTSEGMHALLGPGRGFQQDAPGSSRVAMPSYSPLAFPLDFAAGTVPAGIPVAERSYGSSTCRRPNVTPIPGMLQEWKKHAERGTAGLFNWLSEKPAPLMYPDPNVCLDRCAIGSPGYMAEFCRAHTTLGSPNARRCWQAVEDLEAGDKDACNGRCRAMQHNWGRK